MPNLKKLDCLRSHHFGPIVLPPFLSLYERKYLVGDLHLYSHLQLEILFF